MAMAIIIPACDFTYTQHCHTTVENIGCHIPGCGGTSKDNCIKCWSGEYSTHENLMVKFNKNTCTPTTALTENISCHNCQLNKSHNLNNGLTWTRPDQHNTYYNGATSNNECAIQIDCKAGEYYDNTKYECITCPGNTYKPDSFSKTTFVGALENKEISDSCISCGTNATVNTDHTNCDCIVGYQTQLKITKNVGNSNCEEILYNVFYKEGNTKIQDTISSIGVATKYIIPSNTSTSGQVIDLPFYPKLNKTGYDFDGAWKANRKLTVCNPGQCLGETEAGEIIQVSAIANLTGDDMGDVTFTAVWKAKQFEITYDTGGKCTNKITECTYDSSTCKLDFKCDQQNPGEYIAGWQCTYGCSDKEKIYKSGANISNISAGNTMTLTAIWKTCDAGYYCNGGTQNACPAGCTSDADSDEITDCYLSSDTKFCHDGACFTIPDLKISYSSK